MENGESKRMWLQKARKLLKSGQVDGFWRSFEQVANSPEYEKWLEDEFPERSSLFELDRRNFIKFMGAATLMASLAGCRRLPKEQIVPFVKQPEDSVPGVRKRYATSFVSQGAAMGLVVESREGRPIKVEGNPEHSGSLGSSDVFCQASLYDLYDPDRLKAVQRGRSTASWDQFWKEARAQLQVAKEKNGQGVVLLTESVVSPSYHAQIQKFLQAFPEAKWVAYDPLAPMNVLYGNDLLFDRKVNAVYDFSGADVILSVDSDFLYLGPGAVRYAREFSSRRAPQGTDASKMNRMFAIQCAPSVTSAAADEVLALKPTLVEPFLRALAVRLGIPVAPGDTPPKSGEWIEKLAAQLQASRGRCVVVPGLHHRPMVHALAQAINVHLGNVGATVRYTRPLDFAEDASADGVSGLQRAARQNPIDAVFILGGNPAYTLPGGSSLGRLLEAAPFSAHLTSHSNETSELCRWELPLSHYLEAWGDGLGYDGSTVLQQPLIAPLYHSLSEIEFIEGLLGSHRTAREVVKEVHGFAGVQGEDRFQSLLEKGVLPTSEFGSEPVEPNFEALELPPALPSGYELIVLPDPTVLDGRFANNPWLQELPKPMSSLTWDNAVYVGPAMAERIGAGTEDKVSISVQNRKEEAALFVMPGIPDETVVVHMGYGRKTGGMWVTSDGTRGFNAFLLMNPASPGVGTRVAVVKLDGKMPLASVQVHHSMEGKDIVRSGTVAEFKAKPSLAPEYVHEGHFDSLYPEGEFEYDGHKWAMSIDLSLCIGCNACTIACQAENNIPSVGKTQVQRGREMHWIRVDRYYKGSPDTPEQTLFQPLPCMHCENAPCEPVCPVAATTHSKEGLNQMVYNRCVGTRYCSNNCPYKVRRFNYLNFADKTTDKLGRDAPTLRLLNNPDVTVRGRGVMEKCTFCVQRINSARIESKRAGAPLKDGDIVTACQQACPTQAIVFGDMSDPASRVSKLRSDPRSYGLLADLNTRPRTTYLAKVTNPSNALSERGDS